MLAKRQHYIQVSEPRFRALRLVEGKSLSFTLSRSAVMRLEILHTMQYARQGLQSCLDKKFGVYPSVLDHLDTEICFGVNSIKAYKITEE